VIGIRFHRGDGEDLKPKKKSRLLLRSDFQKRRRRSEGDQGGSGTERCQVPGTAEGARRTCLGRDLFSPILQGGAGIGPAAFGYFVPRSRRGFANINNEIDAGRGPVKGFEVVEV